MTKLLDDLNEITQEEIELAALVTDEQEIYVTDALCLRSSLKVQAHRAGIYLSDRSLDSLTTALLNF